MWRPRCGVANGCLAAISIFAAVVSSQDFGYDGQHGPDHWGDDYQRCSGKFQSPINIDVLNVTFKSFPDLEYFDFDVTPKNVHMTNNGHTVLVTMEYENGKQPYIKGGPLDKTNFLFEQFHFHWGENDTVGSEDLINNRAFPAELHLVVRSDQYKDFKSALNRDHGIAVLAFFFQIIDEENPSYGEFAEQLRNISHKGQSVDLVQPLPLFKFLGIDLVNYFTYVGSLTTPPCAEKVVWIDYYGAIKISEHQLNHFRQLTASNDHLSNNFRPTQPLNDRVIFQNDPPSPSFSMNNWGAIPFVDAANAVGSVAGSGFASLLLVSLLVLLEGNVLVALN